MVKLSFPKSKNLFPCETIPKLSGAYMRTPPENVKNRDFPQLQYAVKFFEGEISIHNKSIKCQFRLDLSNTRNQMLTANLEKNLEGWAATPPRFFLAFFIVIIFFASYFLNGNVFRLL